MVKKMLNPIIAATIIMILYMIMPVMTVIISKFITTYAYMLMCVVLFCFIMLTGGIKRLSAMVYVLAPLGLLILYSFFVGNEPLVIMGYQGVLTLLTVAAGYYYLYYRSDAIPVFSKIILAAIIVTAVTTIIGVIRFPEASRILATIATSDDEQNLLFGWNNIGGYEYIYICVLLYPVMILAYKLRKIGRVAFLFMFLLLFILVIFSEYTIALILIMITSFLYFAGKKTNAGQLLLIGIVLFALLFLFQSVVNSFLLWLADTLGSDTLGERLTALAGGVNGLEGSESNRIALYQASIDAFLERPIFGNTFNGFSVGGGHSFILDTLANHGILGGITIVLLYRNIYKVFFVPFRRQEGYGFVLWTFVQTIILSMVNTGMWSMVIGMFVPIFLSQIYNTYDEGYYENSLDY